jgi:hypothetical protein
MKKTDKTTDTFEERLTRKIFDLLREVTWVMKGPDKRQDFLLKVSSISGSEITILVGPEEECTLSLKKKEPYRRSTPARRTKVKN